MPRSPGLSARAKLTLSYAGFLLVAGALLLTAVWVFLLRYVPAGPLDASRGFIPNRGDLIRAFVPAASLVMLGLLALGLVGGWLLAGRMLAPLRRIHAAARLAAEGSLSHRIHLEGPDDEFRELADAFDGMLARIEAHVAEQRRFAANASHELRTPLTITRTLLDVAEHTPDRDDDALIARLQSVNERAIALTEALLLLARSDGGSFEREAVDASLLAEEAMELLLPLAEARGVAIELEAQPIMTSGSAALLEQMMVNLIHNAIVHNGVDERRVRMRLSRVAGRLRITVENSGDVLSPSLVATLVEPFQRGAGRARTEDQAGVGLGLAIVDSIVRAHGGTLALAARDEGGLVVNVELPAL